MITVRGFLSEKDFFLEVQGHDQEDGKGISVLCASVSILARTFLRVLEEEGVLLFSYEQHRGYVKVQGFRCAFSDDAWKFLWRGVKDLEEEFRDRIEVRDQ